MCEHGLIRAILANETHLNRLTLTRLANETHLNRLTLTRLANETHLHRLILTRLANETQLHRQILTRLANEKADVVPEDWSLAVQEITSQIDHHRYLSQLLQQLPCLQNQRKQAKIQPKVQVWNQNVYRCLPVFKNHQCVNTNGRNSNRAIHQAVGLTASRLRLVSFQWNGKNPLIALFTKPLGRTVPGFAWYHSSGTGKIL